MTTPTRSEGRCIWLRQAIRPGETDAPVLEGQQTADICIAGGGMAGLWAALEIKSRDPSCDVAIIESDICGGGASGRNSGMVATPGALTPSRRTTSQTVCTKMRRSSQRLP